MSLTPRTPAGAIRSEQVGRVVDVYGWVHRRRDLGGLIFIDLRDRSGIVQVKFDPANAQAHAIGGELRPESVIHVQGPVQRRPPGTENKELATGEVEVEARDVTILNRAQPPPFVVNDDSPVDEQVRLRYRYLDLRRTRMARNLQLRHRMTKAIRDFLDAEGFLEIETPVLIRSTPEGARDFLVPSRLKPGHVYALAQSPQLYKQLLMVAGMDRYFQIVRCYRDEDQRADRQPEFTQLDLEMSFVGEDDVLDVIERSFAHVWQKVLGLAVPTPMRRITHAEAISRYGVDKPDLRYGLEIHDLSSIFGRTEFKIFRQALDAGGVVRGLRIPRAVGGKEIDTLTEVARAEGAKGLAFWHREADGWRSPIAKFFDERALSQLQEATHAEPGDVVVAVADQVEVASASLGAVRKATARMLGLVKEGLFEFVWVTDYRRDHGRPPSVHRAEAPGPRAANHRPAQGARAQLRPGAEWHRARLGQHPNPRPGVAATRLPGSGHLARGGGKALWISPDGLPLRRAATRRVRLRPRSRRHAGGRRGNDPGGDRLSQEPAGRRADDRCAGSRGSETTP